MRIAFWHKKGPPCEFMAPAPEPLTAEFARCLVEELHTRKPTSLKTIHPDEPTPLLAQHDVPLCLAAFFDDFSGIAWLVPCCLGFPSTRTTTHLV